MGCAFTWSGNNFKELRMEHEKAYLAVFGDLLLVAPFDGVERLHPPEVRPVVIRLDETFEITDGAVHVGGTWRYATPCWEFQ